MQSNSWPYNIGFKSLWKSGSFDSMGCKRDENEDKDADVAWVLFWISCFIE